jgi:hypothetical protein
MTRKVWLWEEEGPDGDTIPCCPANVFRPIMMQNRPSFEELQRGWEWCCQSWCEGDWSKGSGTGTEPARWAELGAMFKGAVYARIYGSE